MVTLGIVNTGVAYWLFYLLIDEAGAAVASVITYLMPVVALFLGVGWLGERLTIGAVAGLVLIALGAWLPLAGGHGSQALVEVPSATPAGNEEISGFAERFVYRADLRVDDCFTPRYANSRSLLSRVWGSHNAEVQPVPSIRH